MKFGCSRSGVNSQIERAKEARRLALQQLRPVTESAAALIATFWVSRDRKLVKFGCARFSAVNTPLCVYIFSTQLCQTVSCTLNSLKKCLSRYTFYEVSQPLSVHIKVYAAPFEAPNVLVMDTATDTVSGIDTESVHSASSGTAKWNAITALGDRVQDPQPTPFGWD